MADWSAGYNVDLGYTYGYYREQDPRWMDVGALVRGVAPPEAPPAGKLRYLELGCGQGLSLCLIAACHPHIEFVGVDFNPQHIAHASRLAAKAGLTNVHFFEADFIDLGRQWPTELGKFHYASAHGIYTWISIQAAKGLVSCLQQALLPGALFYVSYNVLPGWIPYLPIQHLLRLWQVREELSSVEAIRLGTKRLEELVSAGLGMVASLPTLGLRVSKLKELDIAYLTQEYLHETWRPFWFDQVARELAPAKLRYVGTAAAQDWFLTGLLPPAAKTILEQYQDPIEREVMVDVLVNQGFRRDLWARGQPPIWPGDQRHRLLALRVFLLTKPPGRTDGQSPYRYASSLGELTGKPEAYEPIYAALEAGPKTVGELLAISGGPSRPLGDMLQILGLMLSAGHAAIMSPPTDVRPAKALNRALAEAVLEGAPYRYQIAAHLPHVLQLSDTDLMLLALWNAAPKLATPETLGRKLAERLVALGRGLKEGERMLTTIEDITPKAEAIASAFLTNTLPHFQKLGVV